jgi:hypothetical protein
MRATDSSSRRCVWCSAHWRLAHRAPIGGGPIARHQREPRPPRPRRQSAAPCL